MTPRLVMMKQQTTQSKEMKSSKPDYKKDTMKGQIKRNRGAQFIENCPSRFQDYFHLNGPAGAGASSKHTSRKVWQSNYQFLALYYHSSFFVA